MNAVLLVVLVGLLGGVAAGLQGPLAGLMGRQVGILGSVFIIHLGGTLASALILLAPGAADLGAWRTLPWYALGAGTLGIVLVGSLAFSIPRLGMVSTITLVLAAQLLVGAYLDHFGIWVDQARSLDPTRVIGLLVLFAGTWLVVK